MSHRANERFSDGGDSPELVSDGPNEWVGTYELCFESGATPLFRLCADALDPQTLCRKQVSVRLALAGCGDRRWTGL